MQLVYEERFLKNARLLTPPIQKQLAQQLERFQKNPRDPRLHSKMLSGPLVGFFLFRVTRDYRVIFRYLSYDTAQLLIVKHRKDVYR